MAEVKRFISVAQSSRIEEEKKEDETSASDSSTVFGGRDANRTGRGGAGRGN